MKTRKMVVLVQDKLSKLQQLEYINIPQAYSGVSEYCMQAPLSSFFPALLLLDDALLEVASLLSFDLSLRPLPVALPSPPPTLTRERLECESDALDRSLSPGKTETHQLTCSEIEDTYLDNRLLPSRIYLYKGIL